ncbi:MAG: ABC transporter ATP-binding protein/permease [Lachnospiraceae bacterium]|nr:ABC transporter ATP-binding protein/permease [Lachnospiraceae bacterium]
MLKIWKKLSVLLDGKQKRFMLLLLCMMLIGAVLETASVAIVVPVVTVLMDENAITDNAIVATLYDALGFSSREAFATVIMVALIAAFVLKNLFLFFQQKVLYHFVYTNQFRTSERMMKNYMRRDYEFFLNADTAVIQRSITSDVNNMYALILSLMQLVSESIVFVCLVAVLFLAEPMMTLMISALLLVTLLVIKAVLKPLMQKAGKDNQDYYSSLFKWISESVTGIKEIKTGGREQYFVDEYIRCGHGYVNAVQKYTLYNNIPRLLIETVSVTAMVLYLLILMLSGRDTSSMMAIIGAFGLAVMRLMPSANRINNQLNNIAYFEPFLMGVSDSLQDEISGEKTDMADFASDVTKLPVKEKIELKNICYHYPNTEVEIFDHADLTIPVGKSIGIVGASGAGKSTIVDVLLGMLRIQGGTIKADGKDVLAKENYRGWLRNIGYIPQTIFMLDDTIRRNVAFGIPEDKVSEERIWEVLKDAQLDEFVRGLPEGLETGIGERGVRLSGGQRQRIGIARALYEDPEVLILDEATSALDNDTESAIMESINRFQGKKTLIIIAHRLQTIEKCDMVYRVEGGKIRAND